MEPGDKHESSRRTNVTGAEVDYTCSPSGTRFAAVLTLDCGHKVIHQGRRNLRFIPPPAANDYEWVGGRKRCWSCNPPPRRSKRGARRG